MEIKELWENFKSNKKAQIIAIVILVVLIASTIMGILVFGKKDNNGKNNNINAVSGKLTARAIDGVMVPENKANLFPLTIMIENYKDVRPQYSLGKANLVYEALAEGGITRFLAVYATDEQFSTIGPVRSARHYFVDLAEEYHGLFVHIGGSPEALGILSYQDYLTDLNQFGYSQYYWRDEEKEAPHNLFTSSELLAYAIRDLELNTNVQYTAWQFKDEAKKAERPQEEKYVKINYSTEDYFVEWKYNKENNVYLRYNGGVEHKDALTDKQIEAKNIIVQYAATELMDENTGRLDIITQGEGKAIMFMDGAYIEGTWKKTNRGDRTKFYDGDDKEISFNPGATWIEIVQDDTGIEWPK